MKSMLIAKYHMQDFFNQLKEDESGLATIEIALIIIAIVAVAVIFRDQLTKVMTELMNKVKSIVLSF